MVTKIDGKLLLYILLLGVHVALVWWLPYFPSQDGPSHVYNLVILRDLLNGGYEWGDFFTYQLRAVPNLGFHLVAYPLLLLFPPLIVEKLFVSLYILLMGSCVPVFFRAFDRPVFPFAYLVFPVIFNYTLFMGFYSYVIAVPIFLIAFSIAWRIRTDSIAHRFVCLNLAGLLVFYCHLIPFVIYLISLMVICLANVSTVKRKAIDMCSLLLTISPLLLTLLLYMNRSIKGAANDFSYVYSAKHYIESFESLFFFSMIKVSPSFVLPGSLVSFIYLFFLSIYIHNAFKSIKSPKYNIREIPLADRPIIFILLILIVIYMLAPFRLGEGSYFDQRFPWVIYLIAMPLLRFKDEIMTQRFVTVIVAMVVSFYAIVNANVMHKQSVTVGKFLKGVDTSLPKGSFIMTYKTKFPEWSGVDVLMHASSYYGIKNRYVDIGNYEAGLPYFPVQFKKIPSTFPPTDQIIYEAATIKWSRYPCIRFLFAWEINDTERAELIKYYDIMRQEGQLTIWQRKVTCP